MFSVFSLTIILADKENWKLREYILHSDLRSFPYDIRTKKFPFRDHIYSHNLSLDCVLNYRCCCYRCLYSLTRRVNIFPKNYFESSFVRIKYLI